MFGLMLITENEREKQVLTTAFEQRGIQVIHSRTSFANYTKMMQFMPDILIIELPRICFEQLNFIDLVRKHKKTHKVPIAGYGAAVDPGIKNGYVRHGINCYFERPLKFSKITAFIESTARQLKKELTVSDGRDDKDHDMELLRAADTVPMKKIEIMCRYISNLLAFPFTVAKVIQLTGSDSSGARDLTKVIEADPVIATHILKVSNSIFFASLNRRISSINDAIVRIGFRETKRIVLSMSVMTLFDPENKTIGFSRIGFWYHSLACGVIAEAVAKRMGDVSSEEAFLAGLLHDFGVILLDEFYPEIFLELLDRTTDAGSLFIEASRHHLGIHHNDLVAELFKKWKMPEQVTAGVLGQYEVNSYDKILDTTDKRLALCVALGNLVSKTVSIGNECDQFIQPLDRWAFKAARLDAGLKDDFLESVYREVEMYGRMLNLEKWELPVRQNELVRAETKKIGIMNMTGEPVVPPFIYLKKEGFQVEPVSLSARPSTFNQKFDLVMAWCRPDHTPERLDDYAHILKRSDQPLPPDAKPVYAPLLAIGAQCEMQENGAELPPGITCMDRSFDLRELDKTVVLLCENGSAKTSGKPAAQAA